MNACGQISARNITLIAARTHLQYINPHSNMCIKHLCCRMCVFTAANCHNYVPKLDIEMTDCHGRSRKGL